MDKMEYFCQNCATKASDVIEMLISEIEVALDNGLYMIALSSALILPDTLGKMEYPKNEEKSSKKRYIQWVDEYIYKLIEEGDFPDNFYICKIYKGENLYNLRCKFLHEGFPIAKKYEEDMLRAVNSDGCLESGVEAIDNVLDSWLIFESDETIIEFQGKTVFPTVDKSKGRIYTKKVTQRTESRVSVQNICDTICVAARKYLNENLEKFSNLESIKIIDMRESRPKSNRNNASKMV